MKGSVLNTFAVSRNAVNPIRPIHREAISRVSRVVESEPSQPTAPQLIGPNGETVELPEEIYRVLSMVVSEMKSGNAVSITPLSQRITTQEAADLLGVSRPTLVKLLETGEIAYEKPGRHRRVLLSDVLQFRDEKHHAAMNTLDQLTAEANEAGLYDASSDDYRGALATGRAKDHRTKTR